MKVKEPIWNGNRNSKDLFPSDLKRRTAPTSRLLERDERDTPQGAPPVHDTAPVSLAHRLAVPATREQRLAAARVSKARVAPLRDYDQISMRDDDLLRQVQLMQPLLAGRRVVFMGDNDGASLLLGLLGVQGAPCPAHMTLLDFDRRILAAAMNLAREGGFADRMDFRAYNAFDRIPTGLAGQFDVFYTNPPYGKQNVGASGRLFVTRGIELCHGRGGACGCVILPDDDERPWTASAMLNTQHFLTEHGWLVRDKLSRLHHYDLQSDPGLTSSTVWVCHVLDGRKGANPPHFGEAVSPSAVTHFYGRKVKPPYPHYVREDGTVDGDWVEEVP